VRRIIVIRKEIIETLRIIKEKLKDTEIRWVLVGSLSLALQGITLEPNDIDILTDKEGAFEINKLFKEYEVKPVRFKRSEHLESYLGEFRINGVKVEVMGDLKEKDRNSWKSLSDRLVSPKIVEIEGMQIPVSKLEEQLKSYEKIRTPKARIRVKKIREVLEKGF
jgi:hypothetical protein